MYQYVHHFDEQESHSADLLGGKGANLAEMTRLGFPVPPGFTIATKACLQVIEQDEMPAALVTEVDQAMVWLEQRSEKSFGDAERPLLVSVRSGAPVSMPGMMDTLLNVGLNDISVRGLAKTTDNIPFAFDCYRRLIEMFGSVVLGVEGIKYHRAFRLWQSENGDQTSTASWQKLIDRFLKITQQESGRTFPQEPREQLWLAVEAVFRSWNSPRAKAYRKAFQLSDAMGTAVNVQQMVFGNWDDSSGTGVLFTRNPSTGANELYGEFLAQAQGEDVVSGSRTPLAIIQLRDRNPELYDALVDVAEQLETHFEDAQDIEFTYESGQLFLLQTRHAKRTSEAAIRIAVDLVDEGKLTREQALQRIQPEHLSQLLHPSLPDGYKGVELAQGLPASPGAASGVIVFDPNVAEEWGKNGKRVVLVRVETTPDDVHGMMAAAGVLTAHGGMTSHAAVVARGMGTPCVCGVETAEIDETKGELSFGNGQVLREGDGITLDGDTGRILEGQVELVPPKLSDALQRMLGWADGIRRMAVLANADTPVDAKKAIELGAEGIGLCRTEHMFMEKERIRWMRRFILAKHDAERDVALKSLHRLQTNDFEELFRVMDGLPITIRLLDPPLHEFLPKQGSHQATGEELESLRRAEAWRENNPMLGLRGCRLGIVFPELYDMQVRAIGQAAERLRSEGIPSQVKLMLPMISTVKELAFLRGRIMKVLAEVWPEAVKGDGHHLAIGTMIEVPRAAITAGQIAQHADFFSFGTNDLTQMTMALSRDDAEKRFLNRYLESEILQVNPFETLDQDGVGFLMKHAIAAGRAVTPNLPTGICGEHGGDPASIAFCESLGLDSISCSPFRLPVARLAAAQATLASQK